RAPAQIALLYSPASTFWEEKYKGALHSIYSILNLSGQPITFISERQLAEGPRPRVACIVVPQATHVTDQTIAALIRFVEGGGKVLIFGQESLTWDEYHRPRNLPAPLAGATRFEANPADLRRA